MFDSRNAIADDDAVIVMDCDLEFRSKKFMEIIKQILNKPIEEATGGALVSFESNEPRYSYGHLGRRLVCSSYSRKRG